VRILFLGVEHECAWNERFEEATASAIRRAANPFAIAGGMDSDAHEIAVFTV